MLIAAGRSTFTVTQAWYEDVAGASIRVGDTPAMIPEPASSPEKIRSISGNPIEADSYIMRSSEIGIRSHRESA